MQKKNIPARDAKQCGGRKSTFVIHTTLCLGPHTKNSDQDIEDNFTSASKNDILHRRNYKAFIQKFPANAEHLLHPNARLQASSSADLSRIRTKSSQKDPYKIVHVTRISASSSHKDLYKISRTFSLDPQGLK